MMSTEPVSTPRRLIAVLGAGVIGVACARHLQRAGYRVILIDRADPGSGASYGNAGAITVSGCTPLGTPGLLGTVPGMLFDKNAPLLVRWRYGARIAPWIYDLIKASRIDQVRHIADDLAFLLGRSRQDWIDICAGSMAASHLKKYGWLRVFDTDGGFSGNALARRLMSERGLSFDVLSASELHDLEPNLSGAFRHAVLMRDGLFLSDPKRVVGHWARDFIRGGGIFLQTEVLSINPTQEDCRIVTSRETVEADTAVICLGAHSRAFASQLGATVRLDTERGYHIMLPSPVRSIRHPTVWSERGAVLSPMDDGLRFSTGVEFAGISAEPDYTRIRRMLRFARQMLPTINLEERSVWMGCRPSVPDSVPIIARAPRAARVILAFGHGHIGMTLGPTTGRLVADMVGNRQISYDMHAFDASRERRLKRRAQLIAREKSLEFTRPNPPQRPHCQDKRP